eukprot:CAMPEP_0177219796 /NCGR_PEP_ID=MMETSP0367-20130122/36550_1 /TAXON_ID=447022 ORGANISM="Scrippsiella hangoei-like, Strain SHHI-4" /NCGR_SAMPLE_ID=MMETSP0367 /ASSEMBLY_ACC=CAM_ASM_000362 /LENGTH=167 /DNA_ID=CAMNT_0018669539 /DNA_START=879 /DNA_END=1382 /DNA_ORIENTATION=-
MTAKASPMFFCNESKACNKYMVLTVFTVKDRATMQVMWSQPWKNPFSFTDGSMLLKNTAAIAHVVAKPEIFAKRGMSEKALRYFSESTAQLHETATLSVTKANPMSGREPEEPLLPTLEVAASTKTKELMAKNVLNRMCHCKELCREPFSHQPINAVISSFVCSNTW